MVTLRNKKQRETLERIFQTPTLKNIRWKDIESLLRHLNYWLKYKSGSAMKIGRTESPLSIVVHRPHPSNKAVPEAVEDIREFLTRMGDTP
jgi:hypothetical protein